MAAKQERDFVAEARLLIRNVGAGTLATAEAGIPHAALVTVAFMPGAAASRIHKVSWSSQKTLWTQKKPLLMGKPAARVETPSWSHS